MCDLFHLFSARIFIIIWRCFKLRLYVDFAIVTNYMCIMSQKKRLCTLFHKSKKRKPIFEIFFWQKAKSNIYTCLRCQSVLNKSVWSVQSDASQRIRMTQSAPTVKGAADVLGRQKTGDWKNLRGDWPISMSNERSVEKPVQTQSPKIYD